jgi:acetoacetyl-CoA synthetase
VYRGQLQTRGLGMNVSVLDEAGNRIIGQMGELVCHPPFPSMPLGFWNDPDQTRYREAYFERYPGYWRHGDWAELTPEGGVIISGRSDTTLNPGGIRIGTAEIYRQVEQFEEVLESLAVAQEFEGDVRVVLFVCLRPGMALTPELEDRIRRRIREAASPHHVPRRIFAVPALPKTANGKLIEMAVRDVLNGREVRNVQALINPEALDFIRSLPALRD